MRSPVTDRAVCRTPTCVRVNDYAASALYVPIDAEPRPGPAGGDPSIGAVVAGECGGLEQFGRLRFLNVE